MLWGGPNSLFLIHSGYCISAASATQELLFELPYIKLLLLAEVAVVLVVEITELLKQGAGGSMMGGGWLKRG
jgi:hypothetical protein